jgi:hypothetical protein
MTIEKQKNKAQKTKIDDNPDSYSIVRVNYPKMQIMGISTPMKRIH